MMIWQWPMFSMRRISFKTSIWRAGDSADSGSSKMKMPWRWQRSSKKRKKPSPCECERKFAYGLWTSSRYLATEKKLSARKNQPLVIFGSQPARSAFESCPPIFSSADRQVTVAAAGFVITGEHGDPFQQGGFAGAIFTDDDGDGAIKAQLELIPQERKAKRISRSIGNVRWLEPDPPEVWCRHPDDAISF